MTETRSQTISINGFDMHYEIRGEGKPLVLLHGGTGVGANWELIFKQPPDGFQLVVPDLRGHGSSTNPSGKFTIQQMAYDVFALLDQLGIEHFKAMGLSLGAKILLHMATQQPTRVEAMVLVSAAPYFPAQARAIMQQLTPESRTADEWRQMRQWHKKGDEQIRALWNMSVEFKDSFTDLNFTPPYLSTITARTLVIHGDRDPLYPVDLAIELYTSIPQSYLWIMPNSGHNPVFGDNVAQFSRHSLAFLRGEWEHK